MSNDTKDNAEKQKHTEGPWCWQSFDGGKTLFLGTPDRGRLVVMDFVRQGFNSATARFAVRSPGMGGLLYPVTESNVLEFPDARLMEASPNLFAACKEANEFFVAVMEEFAERLVAVETIERFKRFKGIGKRIIDAITKAEGGAS